MKLPCEVCGIVTSPVSYKLYICSSCRIFYRRNFHLWGQINCQSGNNCNLEQGARRSCQSCRLRVCREKGLRMVGKSLVVQEAGLPVDDQPEFDPKPVKRSSQESRQRSSSDEEVLTKFPFLQRVVQAFDEFHKRQILVACADRPNELMNDTAENSKQMAKLDFNLMEQRVLCLACGTVNELLNELPTLNAETRVQIIKQTVLDVSIVLKTYLTCRRFPNLGNPKMALFTAYHTDTTDCDAFLVGLPQEFIEKSRKIYDPLMSRCRVSLDRLRHAQLTKVEFAVLLAFCVYECADKEEEDITRQLVFKLRDQLVNELTSYLRQYYESNEICLRMSRLFSFIYDVKHCNQFYTDTFTLAGLFMSEYNSKLTQQPDVSETYIKNVASFMNLTLDK